LRGEELSLLEEVYGTKAKVLASFPCKKNHCLGVKVLEEVAREIKSGLNGETQLLAEGHINSIRQGKRQTSKSKPGRKRACNSWPLDFTMGGYGNMP